MGWSLVDDSADQDSRCDSTTIKGWLDADGDGQVAPAEALARMGQEVMANKLARAICRFPSEWDASSFDRRLGWVKVASAENPTPVDDENFERLRAHVATLAFWPGGMELPESHWHWSPKAFVEHFRKCSWLSGEELAKIYPDTVYPVRALTQIGRTPAGVRDQYRLQINKVARKYFVVSRDRLAHFFGQGAVESMYLALMLEGSANFSRNPAHASFASEDNGYYDPPAGGYLDYLNGRLGNIDEGDGPKFRGRGMKQLTGRENYSKYWVYRGWLDKDSFTSPWWNPAMPARAPNIPDPQRLSTDAYNAIDAGGWYWEAGSTPNQYRSINRSVSPATFTDAAIEVVTRAINGGVNGLPQRIEQTNRIRPVLNDDA
jgi:hydroxyethylthiazole kinase